MKDKQVQIIYHIVNNNDQILCGRDRVPGRCIHEHYADRKMEVDDGRWCKHCQKARQSGSRE